MATDFDVITYANGPFLYDVFNGVASIFGNGNYTVAMATCMTAASIGIMISAVLQGRMVNLLWMLQAIFLYMLLVLPKVSVNIVDKTEIDAAYVSVGAFPSVRRVDNIPIGMALVASSVSTFSSWTVDSFETVFSLPDSMKYTANGPLFGQNLVRKMISYQPNDASLNSNLQEFWRNCVFYDIGLGFYSFNDLSQQNNIVSFLKSNTAMTRGFYQESEGVKSFTDCRAGITKIEQDLIKNQEDFKKASGSYASITMPSNGAGIEGGWTAMPVAFAYLSNVSKSASELLIQSAMMNSMDSGLEALAGNADASAAIQGYALARAERERETTFGVMGKMAAEMLPILKNLMEGLMYAVFPLVGLAILFPNGWKGFGYYAKILLWIGLWPVAFALLHYAMTYFGSFAVQKAAAHYDIAGNFIPAEYNMYSQMGIKEVMAKYEAIAGYMMTMIPMVTYVMVAQGGAMMAGMVGRVMDGYAKPAESAAMEASAGNFSVGNVNLENQRAFQHMSAPSQIAGSATMNNGLKQTTTAEGGTITQYGENKLPTTISQMRDVGNRITEEHTHSLEQVKATEASLVQSTQGMIRQLSSHGSGISNITTTGTQAGHTEGSTNQNAATHINQVARDWVEQNMHSDATLRKLAGDWKVGASVQSKDQFIGKMAAFLTGGSIEASGAISGGISGTTTNADMQQLSARFAASESLQHTLSQLTSDQISTLNHQNTTGSIEQRDALEKAYARMNATNEQHSSALRRSESLRQSASDFNAASVSTNTSLAGAIINRMTQEYSERSLDMAVAAINRGDFADENYQNLQKVVHGIVAENSSQVVNVNSANEQITGKFDDEKEKILSQKPIAPSSNGTEAKVKSMQKDVNAAQDDIVFNNVLNEVSMGAKQNQIDKDGTAIRVDVGNEVGGSTPNTTKGDSGVSAIWAAGKNVFQELTKNEDKQ